MPTPIFAADVFAYGVDNSASPHHDVLAPVAANASKFVFGVPTLRKDQEKACLHLLDKTKPRVLLNIAWTGGERLMLLELLVFAYMRLLSLLFLFSLSLQIKWKKIPPATSITVLLRPITWTSYSTSLS